MLIVLWMKLKINVNIRNWKARKINFPNINWNKYPIRAQSAHKTIFTENPRRFGTEVKQDKLRRWGDFIEFHAKSKHLVSIFLSTEVIPRKSEFYAPLDTFILKRTLCNKFSIQSDLFFLDSVNTWTFVRWSNRRFNFKVVKTYN